MWSNIWDYRYFPPPIELYNTYIICIVFRNGNNRQIYLSIFFLLLFTLFSTSKLFYIVGINEFRGNLPKREFCQGSTSGCYFINILRACLLSNETGNSYSKFILTENLLVQREFSIVEPWSKVHFWKGRYGRSFYGT